MEPFYQVDDITIYHADCADVISLVPPDTVDLLLTDPPYGINWIPPTIAKSIHGNTTHNIDKIYGDDLPFDLTIWKPYKRLVLFGANYWQHPPGGLLIWDKSGGGKVMVGTKPNGEAAWTNIVSGVHVFHHLWEGAFRDYIDNEWRAASRGLHPTQKPVRLLRWIIERWTEPGDLVFDPYMGSGPIAQACLETGRRYIGVEIVEDYCRVAVERLQRTTQPLFVI